MPYTRAQLNKILTHNGQPVIDLLSPVPMAQRVTESYVRRRLYAHEDETILGLHALWKSAFKDIQAITVSAAGQLNVDTLKSDYSTIQWQKAVLPRIERRLDELKDATIDTALRASMASYMLGYYGRAWELDMMTTPDVNVNAPIPRAADVTARVVQPKLQEAYSPDDMIWELLGDDWQRAYDGELSTLFNKVRGSLSSSVAQNLGIPQAARRLAGVMGIETGTDGAFGKINTMSRSYIMGASNSGALDLYQRNSDLLSGYMWLSSKDRRVCPTCLSLNGTTWSFNDPHRLVPPYDSHFNCRCTLIPVLLPDYSVPMDAAPAQTWGEWATAGGLMWLLGELGRGRKTDSSQIGEIDYEWDMWDRMEM